MVPPEQGFPSIDNVSSLIQKLPGMVYRCETSIDWQMLFVSDGCVGLTGHSKADLMVGGAVPYGDLIHPDDSSAVFDIAFEAIEAGTPFNCEYRICCKDGREKWVWEQGVPERQADGTVLINGFITDITPQISERESLKIKVVQKEREALINLTLLNSYKKAVDASEIVSKTDCKGIITYANDEFCKVSGYSREELIGASHNIIRHPDTPPALLASLWETITDRRIWKGVIKNKTAQGDEYYVKTTIVPILDFSGRITEFMAIRHEVTDLIMKENQIRSQTTDALTGFPNRQKLLEDISEQEALRLVIFNIEHFKEVNEYYGFDVGDQLLLDLSELLKARIDETAAKLYKLPGDEFAVLVNNKVSHELFIKTIYSFISDFHDVTFKAADSDFKLRLVAGASACGNYLINAEMALSHAKETGQEFVFFDEDMAIRDKVVSNISLTNRLSAALDEDRIEVYAQKISSNTGKSQEKYECLVRMVDVDGTILLPGSFLTAAKKSRLYHRITQTVIQKSIDYFKGNDKHFSINLGIEDIQNEETIALLVDLLREHKGLGQRLIVEMVEDEGIENFTEVSDFIENIRHLGCKIAIDDFGTGYSNFDYLMRLNVDFIKIDGSIIKNIDFDENARLVTELIVSFAERLNIETIAEFVHSEAVNMTVKSMGVSYAQGFHIGKPKPLADLA